MRQNRAAKLKSVDLRWLRRPEHHGLGPRGRPSMPPRWKRRTTRPGVQRIERKGGNASTAWESKNGRDEEKRQGEEKRIKSCSEVESYWWRVQDASSTWKGHQGLTLRPTILYSICNKLTPQNNIKIFPGAWSKQDQGAAVQGRHYEQGAQTLVW